MYLLLKRYTTPQFSYLFYFCGGCFGNVRSLYSFILYIRLFPVKYFSQTPQIFLYNHCIKTMDNNHVMSTRSLSSWNKYKTGKSPICCKSNSFILNFTWGFISTFFQSLKTVPPFMFVSVVTPECVRINPGFCSTYLNYLSNLVFILLHFIVVLFVSSYLFSLTNVV